MQQFLLRNGFALSGTNAPAIMHMFTMIKDVPKIIAFNIFWRDTFDDVAPSVDRKVQDELLISNCSGW